MKKKDKRFLQKYTEDAWNIEKTILVDKDTGVNYLVVSCLTSLSITPLLNSEGKVVVSNKEEIDTLANK